MENPGDIFGYPLEIGDKMIMASGGKQDDGEQVTEIDKENEMFITTPELLDEYLTIEFIMDYFTTLELFELILLKNPKV